MVCFTFCSAPVESRNHPDRKINLRSRIVLLKSLRYYKTPRSMHPAKNQFFIPIGVRPVRGA
jgi:hypothetical protein